MINQISLPVNLKPRKILARLIPTLDIEEIVVLSGARQVGKTYLLYLLLKQLFEQKKIPLRQIFLFNLEDPQLLARLDKVSIRDLISDLKKQGADISRKIFLFIDEIQYLKYPSSFLKQIFDQYRNIKLIVSGSSSFEMKKKFTDRLTGRKRFFEILPLSLTEMRDFIPYETQDEKQLFQDLLLFGGYPRVTMQNNILEKKNILLGIYNDYVRKDVRDLAKIPDLTSFNNLVGISAAQMGNLISDSGVSAKVGLSRQTVKKYLHLLESTFVISLVRPYSRNPAREFVRMPKVYFKDTGLKNTISGGFSELNFRSDLGALVENAVYLEILKSKSPYDEVFFWRTKQGQEVDFVIKAESGETIPLEVKYQNFKSAKISASFTSFINRYVPKRGYIATAGFEGKMRYKNTSLVFIPAWRINELFIS